MSNVTEKTEQDDVLNLNVGVVFTTGDGHDWQVMANDDTVHAAESPWPNGAHGTRRSLDFTEHELIYVIIRA